MTWDRVHVSGLSLDRCQGTLASLVVGLVLLYCDRNWVAALVYHFKTIEADIEQVTPALSDIYEQNLAADTLIRLLGRRLLRHVRCSTRLLRYWLLRRLSNPILRHESTPGYNC